MEVNGKGIRFRCHWVDSISLLLARLHSEIKDFLNYISPNPAEQFAREVVVAKVKDIVYGLWPNCQVIDKLMINIGYRLMSSEALRQACIFQQGLSVFL